MKFTGQVFDTAGNPLYGASVYVIGNMSIGMSANTFGQFSLNVYYGDTVRISFVGYNPVDVVAKDEKPVSVVLTNSGELEEMIIDVPAKPKSKSNLLWLILGFVAVVAVSETLGKETEKKTEPKKVNV